jgi:hypothetical protein
MDIVLDSVCVNHLSKTPAKRMDDISMLVVARRVRLVLDSGQSIADDGERRLE